MKGFVVAAVQMESAMGDVPANAAKICSWIEVAARERAQLVFFPECCLTGYSTTHADKVAVPVALDEAMDLERLACELGVAVGYGYIERRTPEVAAICPGEDGCAASSGKPCITYVVAGRDGRLVYRKTHLGSRELQAFEAGNELPVARIEGVSIGVELCWEAHIPDITATLRAKGAELVLVPHAVGIDVARRMELWGRYLPARAYDNGLFVVACNALQHDEEGVVTGGGMMAFGPDGTSCAAVESSEEGMLFVSIGGMLPRENVDGGMRGASYFDRRRPELYSV